MIFQKQRLLFLWIGILSFLAAFVWSILYKDEANTLRYKKAIETYLYAEETKADKILADKDFIQKLINNNPNAAQEILDATERLKNENFSLVVYKNRKAVYWTRNDVVPSPDINDVGAGYNKTFSKFVIQDESQYEQRKRIYKTNDTANEVTAVVLIPIKKAYKSFEGKYLHAYFPASNEIPSQLILDTVGRNETYAHFVSTSDNPQTILCHLKSDEAGADEKHDAGMFMFFILGFVCIGFFGDDLAKQLLKHYKQPTIGISFFLFFAGLLRVIIYLIQTRGWLPTLKVSMGDSSGTFITSLPQLWIDTLFCFWIAVFLNRHLVIAHSANLEVWKRAVLSPIYYIVIVWLNICAIGIFDDLVTTSTGIITFDSLTEFNFRSVSALCAVSIFMFSVFLISERMMRLAGSLNLSPSFQISAAIEACLLGWVTFEMLNLHHDLPNWVYIMYISAYIIFMHLFVTEKRPTIVWLITWLVLFSFAESFFISHFNGVKEKSMFVSYAKRLSVPEDLLAERYIVILKRSIENDPIIKAALMNDEIKDMGMVSGVLNDEKNIAKVVSPKDSTLATQSASIKIDKRIQAHFDSISYLNSHYDFKFFGFRRNSVAVIQAQDADLIDFKNKHDAGKPVNNSKRLSLWSNKEGDWAYLDYAEIVQPLEPDNPTQIAMKITRNDKISGVLSSELLSDNNFKGMKDLSKLEYGVYKNGRRIEPNFTGVKLILNKDEIPPTDSSVFFQDNEKRGVIYRSHDGTIVKISRDNVVSSQTLALCAFIIIVWAFLLFLMAAINNYLSFLPPFMNFSLSLSYNRSFSNRLMLPLVAFLFISYIIIFYFNMRYTEDSKETLITHELNIKYEPIVAQLFEQIINAPDSLTKGARKEVFLNKILQKYGQTNETALHIYDTDGYLLATTETNLFDKGLISRYMNASAYRKLMTAETNSSFKSDERIGNFHYKTNYYNILGNDKKLIGFLETPLYSGDRNLKLSAYATRSSNLFYLAILFLLGILAVYEITKFNMRPIRDIADKLKNMTIGNKLENERIDWSRNDEIGVLVNAYNNKIEELKDSFEKNTEAERAMAWKSMAQHVAHEIRNPLTPIKMVVSHLSFIKDLDDATFKEIALRSAELILDQVIVLERITNEFAFFAKMPQNANNSAFELNELIDSVTTLFISGNNDKNIKIIKNLPDEILSVYADKNHLLGAFNNLIKNAIQAIPPDRPGAIRVSLYRQKNKAIVRIGDNGVGIPKDVSDKVFSQNFTTKLQGSGIGLYYTKQIIQSAGGKIYFDSVEDIGTDFFVELDIYENAPVEEQKIAGEAIII